MKHKTPAKCFSGVCVFFFSPPRRCFLSREKVNMPPPRNTGSAWLYHSARRIYTVWLFSGGFRQLLAELDWRLILWVGFINLTLWLFRGGEHYWRTSASAYLSKWTDPALTNCHSRIPTTPSSPLRSDYRWKMPRTQVYLPRHVCAFLYVAYERVNMQQMVVTLSESKHVLEENYIK